MKQSMHVVLAAALLAAAFAPRAQAKDGPKEGPKAAAAESRPDPRIEKLGLTPEQGEKLKAVFKAEREAMKPLHREMRDAMTKLSDLVEDKAADGDLQAAIDRVSKARKAIQAEREKAEAAVSFLPVAARAKLMLAIGRRMGGGMGGGMGGPRMGKGPRQGMRPGGPRGGAGGPPAVTDEDDGPDGQED